MKIKRSEFLQRLLAVKPGLSSSETIQQSNCIILKKGKLHTFNREIACRIDSGLDPGLTGAIKAKTLGATLSKWTEDYIDLEADAKSLSISGANRRAKLAFEQEIYLPIDSVEIPKDWSHISEEFTEAVELTSKCTKRKDEFYKCCIHIHPKWMEASDNLRMARWTIPTFVEESVLVRGISLKSICPLGMTKAAETQNWLHFRNPFGLRLSIRKWQLEDYPSLSSFFKLRGSKIILPKLLGGAADRAGDYLDTSEGGIKISLSLKKIKIEGEGAMGEYMEERKIKYKGVDMSFLIPPKLVGELVKQESDCEINDSCLRVNGGNYVYLSSLEKVNNNQNESYEN